MPKPTQHEMIEQMWYWMSGTNGEGAADQIRYIKDNMMTKDECQKLRHNNGASNKTIFKRRGVDAAIIGLIIAAVTGWESIVTFFQRLFG